MSILVLFSAVMVPSARGAMAPAEISLTPGAPIYSGPGRPDVTQWTSLCSTRRLACVHSEPAVASSALAALRSLEASWETLTGALGYPPPDPAPETGVYDLYLVDRAGASETFISERTPASAVDRASAYSFVDGRSQGCQRDLDIARQLARAIGARLAPANDEGSASAQATYLARLAVPCAMGLVDGVDVFQRHPEKAFPSALEPKPYRDGSALFYWWLDDAFGVTPGALSGGLWVTTPTRTPPGHDRFMGEPDGFDVLRTTLRGTLGVGSTLDDVLLDFAVARARRAPGVLEETRTFGDAMRIEEDWSIPWPQKPRALLSPRPPFPTGSSYVRVTKPPKGGRLRVEIEWENHARMRWTALKLGADGAEKARVPVGSHDRTTTANLTLTELDETAEILLVGVHCGDWKPFDPEDREWSPHGWVVTVAAE